MIAERGRKSRKQDKKDKGKRQWSIKISLGSKRGKRQVGGEQSEKAENGREEEEEEEGGRVIRAVS